MKALEDNGKQLVKSNEISQKDINIERYSIPLEEQKKFLLNLLKECLLNLKKIEKRVNSDNLIYKYKSKRKIQKDFRNYQNLIELFKNLRDDNINPKKVLKNQINFKSDLEEIKKRKSRLKIKR